jgi:hypothetical protein
MMYCMAGWNGNNRVHTDVLPDPGTCSCRGYCWTLPECIVHTRAA